MGWLSTSRRSAWWASWSQTLWTRRRKVGWTLSPRLAAYTKIKTWRWSLSVAVKTSGRRIMPSSSELSPASSPDSRTSRTNDRRRRSHLVWTWLIRSAWRSYATWINEKWGRRRSQEWGHFQQINFSARILAGVGWQKHPLLPRSKR